MDSSAAVDIATTSPQTDTTPFPWITWIAIVGLVAALYAAVIADLGAEWWTEDSSSYGMLIPPTAFILLICDGTSPFVFRLKGMLAGCGW